MSVLGTRPAALRMWDAEMVCGGPSLTLTVNSMVPDLGPRRTSRAEALR